MNLQAADQDKRLSGNVQHRRNNHVIRFSQIDGAGIVYYPRYFEILADSYPQECVVQRPTAIDLTFHYPIRLGEQLALESQSGAVAQGFSVSAWSGGKRCFDLQMTPLELAEPMSSAVAPLVSGGSKPFVRMVQISDWMTGKNSRLHLSRCYELTAELMESWFSDFLDSPYATLQSADKTFIPTVNLQSEIHDLPRSGEWVAASLVVLHVGRSSLQLGLKLEHEGRLMLSTQQTIVFARNLQGKLSSCAIPAPLLGILNC